MINKIYHLADIHFRNVKRHKEYKQVLQQFLDNVDNDDIDDSIIYIGGDIVHAKTEMSPELVSEVSWFLKECADRKPTIVITGNHDCNLNNSYRMDAITPIVDNLDHNNLHYYRDTGVYEFENLTFVVYSILDHKDNWPSGEDVKGDNKICLFHGPVNKAKTDIGYTITSHKFTPDMFNGFDMALLGDIHKRQDLGKGYEHVVYCGSTVQQNHGELLEGHGYLLWDVESRTYEEFDIHNDYGYVTVDINDGKIPQWVYDEKDTKLPKNPRLRVRFNNTEPTDMKLAVSELKQMFDISEVSVTRTDTIGNLKQNNNVNSNIVGNINEVPIQNNLISDYLKRQFSLESDKVEKILDINQRMNNEISQNEIPNNVLWIPKKFEFENMFSYGEDNKIDFTKTEGIVGIFAPNASGKSAIFDALSFCLFDKSARTHLSKNIINNQSETFKCKFEFEINSISYFIERRGAWVRNDTAVKVDVDFWKEVGGEKISLNGEQRRDTNKIIENYIGTFDDFILTALSVQGNNALFIDKSQSERKEILSQFIGIDIFEKLYTVANEESKGNFSVIKKFKETDFTAKFTELQESLDENQKEYNDIETELNVLESEQNTLNDEILSLTSKIVSLKNDKLDIDELTKDKKKYSNLQKEYLEKKKKLQNLLSTLEDEKVELENKLSALDEAKIIENHNNYNELTQRKSTIENKIEKVDIKLESLRGQLSHLNEHEYDPDCEICMKNSKSIRSSKEDVSKKITDLEKSEGDLKDMLNGVNIKLGDLTDSQEKYETLTNLKESIEENKKSIANIYRKLETNGYNESMNTQKLEEVDRLIDEYHENEGQIKSNTSIRKKIEVVESNLDTVKQSIKKKSKNLLSLNGEISTITSKLEQLNENIQMVNDLEDETRLFDYYLETVGKNGIPYELIEKSLPVIEGEVNNILSQIVDFSMVINMDGKNIDSYIVYDDDRYWSLEMCSGMEKFISGLAIRVALINICNLPRPNFLVIDEGFGTLDSDNLQSLFMLFNYLKSQFDYVMVISHIYSMRDVVDKLIDIKKINGRSNIRY